VFESDLEGRLDRSSCWPIIQASWTMKQDSPSRLIRQVRRSEACSSWISRAAPHR